MVIAADFVFVHLSKTGGTFVEETLKEILCRSKFSRKLHGLRWHHGLRIPFYKYCYEERYQHSLCNDIPQREQSKTILSCIRNPFDLYVSEYTFNWWKKYPHLWFHDPAAVAKSYPNWRELNFDAFIAASNRYTEWVHKALVKYPQTEKLGWYTHKFIYYYCRDHDYVFQAADELDSLVKRARETMYPVHFIHTNLLNEELFEFLLSKGYPRHLIDSIPRKTRINTSRSNHDYRGWYDDRLRHEIEQRDALIFRLFPEFEF